MTTSPLLQGLSDSLYPINQGSFLQSVEWANFQKNVGNRVVEVPGETGIVYGFILSLGYGLSCLYVPRADLSTATIQRLQEKAKEMRTLFLRIEPLRVPVPSASGVHLYKTKHRQHEHTLFVPLDTEEAVLRGMHAKTRYNIGLSQKKGVVIQKEKNLEVFWSLMTETTERDGFHAHEKKYYAAMLDIPTVTQYVAYREQKPIASIITIRHENNVTYLHGASAYADRAVMAPYALQWQAMKDALQSGASLYDLWGVAPRKDAGTANAETFHMYTWDTTHPFHGITRFKAGFGGVPHQYPAAVEIPIREMMYKGYRFMKQIRSV